MAEQVKQQAVAVRAALEASGLDHGTEAITGKPHKPTTQGKNERFHQTLFRYLDKQPLAATLAELQAQIDVFDHVYNTERPHQGLPGLITPLAAWEATAKVEPPRPKLDRPVYRSPVPAAGASAGPARRATRRHPLADGELRRSHPSRRRVLQG